LVIHCGCESLCLFGWDGTVSVDEVGHDSTGGLDTHGKWSNVNEKDVVELLVLITSKESCLNCSTVGNGFVWVDLLVECFAIEEV